MSPYNIAEASAHLSELLQRAVLGEDVLIALDEHTLVRLVPVAPARATRIPGSAKGKIIATAPDFDDPLSDFQPYG